MATTTFIAVRALLVLYLIAGLLITAYLYRQYLQTEERYGTEGRTARQLLLARLFILSTAVAWPAYGLIAVVLQPLWEIVTDLYYAFCDAFNESRGT